MKDFDVFLSDLSTLISYKSVSEKGKGDAPFGEEVKKALNFFLKRAEDFGLTTVNYDNYAGEVYYGDGVEIGIMGHLDVVPEGEGWNSPPFVLTKKDGYIFGRGVLDDKMPLLLQLYALKELKDEGIKFNKKIRLFLGCDEEKGWKDVEYLKTKTTLPEYGYSPDGDFPVSYAEKGMAIVEFYLPKLKNFYNLSGGTVINAVPSEITAKTKLKIKYSDEFIKIKDNKIIASGVSAHGAYPEKGVNAIGKLFEFLIKQGEDLKWIYDALFLDSFNLKNLSSEQGYVTLSPNLICETDEKIILKCDVRYPYPFTEKDVMKTLDEFGYLYSLTVKHGTQYVEKDGFLVSTLLNAYAEETKEHLTPISQRGSTFARVFNKGVAFGPEFPSVKSTIHEPNERIDIKSMLKMFDIYKSAIKKLISEK